jgi:acetate kinase
MSDGEHVTRILTINSGSSSLKFALFQMEQRETLVLSGRMERIGLDGGTFQVKRADGAILVERSVELADHDSAFQALVAWLSDQPAAHRFDAVGHRVVHGGTRYGQPHRITPEVIAILRDLVSFAPNHLPHQLKAIEAVSRTYPTTHQVACFDTAFHRHMPREAQTYALPASLRDEGLLRYGFHGLSYEYIVAELQTVAPEEADGRLIIAHLGNGASMVAVRQGLSLDTTMGFTPAGGLVMSTRSGDLDPGVILYLLDKKGLSSADVSELVNHRAGLLGLSDISSDVKDLLEKENADPRAAQAVELFCYQAKKFLASLTAVLGGLETLIFTAGIGEHAPSIRWRICRDLAFLGVRVDRARNDANAPVISPDDSTVTVRVMRTNEELMIARHTANVLQKPD